MDNKRTYIIPIVAMVVFCIILIGASYSFVTNHKSNYANVITTTRLEMPAKCTFTAQPYSTANCNITSTESSTYNYDDSVITSREMSNDFLGDKIAAKSCGIKIQIQGANCRCPYTLSIEDNGSYNRYFKNNNEYTASIIKYTNSSSTTMLAEEANITNYLKTIDYNVLNTTVANQSTIIYYTLNTKFYNTIFDQKDLIGKNISFKLKVTPGDCNPSIVCKTTGSATYTKGQSFTCNLNGTDYPFYFMEYNQIDSNKIDFIMANNLVTDSSNPSTYIPSSFYASTEEDGEYLDSANQYYPWQLYSMLEKAQRLFGNNVLVTLPTETQLSRLNGGSISSLPSWLTDSSTNGYYTSTINDSNNNISIVMTNNIVKLPLQAQFVAHLPYGFRPVITVDASLVKKV